MQEDATIAGSAPSAALTDIPLALLRAELERRSETGLGLVGRAGNATDGADVPGDGSTCGSERPVGSYNMAVHVGALFLILFLSTFGMSLFPYPWICFLTVSDSHSMLVPYSCSSLPPPPHPPTIPLSLPPFWHRRPDSHCFCAPLTDGVYISDGSVSAAILE